MQPIDHFLKLVLKDKWILTEQAWSFNHISPLPLCKNMNILCILLSSERERGTQWCCAVLQIVG